MSDYFNTMDALAGRVAGLLAISIGVDPGRFEDSFSESLNGLRLIRYSPQV